MITIDTGSNTIDTGSYTIDTGSTDNFFSIDTGSTHPITPSINSGLIKDKIPVLGLDIALSNAGLVIPFI